MEEGASSAREIAAGAGTIWRNYLAPVGDQTGQTADRQIDGLADLGAALARGMEATTPLWRMRNGYALPDRDRLSEVEAYIAALDEVGRDALRACLRVGVHRDVGFVPTKVRNPPQEFRYRSDLTEFSVYSHPLKLSAHYASDFRR